MSDFIDVVEHNPIVFVKTVSEKVAEGYAVTNTIAGYPNFSPYGNTIRLFKQEKPSSVVIAADHNGFVEHYDPMEFMLTVQNFVNAGFKFKDNGTHFFDEKGLKSVQFEVPTAQTVEERVAEVKEEEAEVVKDKEEEVVEPQKEAPKPEAKKPAAKKGGKAPAKKELKAEPTKDELEKEGETDVQAD